MWRRCKTIATVSLIPKGSRKIFNSQSDPPCFSIWVVHLNTRYALVVFKELSKGAKPSSKVHLKRQRLENGYNIGLHTQQHHLPISLTALCLAQEEVRLLDSWCLFLNFYVLRAFYGIFHRFNVLEFLGMGSIQTKAKYYTSSWEIIRGIVTVFAEM